MVTTVTDLRRVERARLGALLLGALAAFLVIGSRGALFFREESLVALTLLVLGAALIMVRAVAGVYLVVFFVLLGDSRTAPWYPFNKNFSSRESLLYASDAVIINPLELFLVVTTISWLLRLAAAPRRRFRRGVLLGPIAVFAFAVVVGLVYGLGRGGDTNIGLWEARPLLYLPILYVLVTNLFDRADQYRRLVWVVVVALVGQSLVALHWYYGQTAETRESLDRLTEHSASVHLNAFIVLALALWLLPRCSAWSRVMVLAFSVPILWVYILSQRRAAFIGLSLGVILLAVLLYKLHRRAFWWFVPIVGVGSVLYLGAFWGVEGGLGFPAQSIKSVVAPDTLGERNLSSNLYRELEARNVWFTLRADPVRGVGFGQPFYQVFSLPDISFFPFWEYMPHHSLLWIWLKTGFLGFVTMLFLIVRTIQHGVRSVFRIVPGELRAMTVMAVLYVVMYTVYAYVDIAWDTRSMVFLAVALALCADMVDSDGARALEREHRPRRREVRRAAAT